MLYQVRDVVGKPQVCCWLQAVAELGGTVLHGGKYASKHCLFIGGPPRHAWWKTVDRRAEELIINLDEPDGSEQDVAATYEPESE